MKKQIGVFTIHGIGSQKAGFSTGLVEQLCKHLGNLRSRFQWEEIHWANVMKAREDILMDCMREATDQNGAPLKLDWMSARNFMVNGFGDALAYHRDFESDSAYSVVHQVISSTIENFYSTCPERNTPVVVLAHSLGCHIMSNYLWDTQQRGYKGPFAPLPSLVGFVSFGCNIPLFSLAFPSARPRGPNQVIKGDRDDGRLVPTFDLAHCSSQPVVQARNALGSLGCQLQSYRIIADQQIRLFHLNRMSVGHEYCSKKEFILRVASPLVTSMIRILMPLWKLPKSAEFRRSWCSLEALRDLNHFIDLAQIKRDLIRERERLVGIGIIGYLL